MKEPSFEMLAQSMVIFSETVFGGDKNWALTKIFY